MAKSQIRKAAIRAYVVNVVNIKDKVSKAIDGSGVANVTVASLTMTAGGDVAVTEGKSGAPPFVMAVAEGVEESQMVRLPNDF